MSPLFAPAALPAKRELGLDRIHVWTVRVEQHRDRECGFFGVLDARERERAGRFRRETDRLSYVVAHGALRVILAHYVDAGPGDLRFAEGPFGKPAICEAQAAGVDFNLSHSGDLVLIAAARRRALGVDVERWADFDYGETAHVGFSNAERRQLEKLPEGRKAAGFFAGWTRKEAYIKATGLGVSGGLDHFDVSLAPGRRARLLADRRAPNVERWRMDDLRLPAGYSGALVAEAGNQDAVPMFFHLPGAETT